MDKSQFYRMANDLYFGANQRDRQYFLDVLNLWLCGLGQATSKFRRRFKTRREAENEYWAKRKHL